YVHVLCVQLPTPNGTSRVATRLAQYVQLKRNTAFLCCQDSDRVNWLPLEHIHHQVDRIWARSCGCSRGCSSRLCRTSSTSSPSRMRSTTSTRTRPAGSTRC